MGLKLNELTGHHATGELDGMPFSVKVLRNKAEVMIGDAKAWRASQLLDGHKTGEPLSRSTMNQLVYSFIAKYRNATRPAYA